jgi:Leucine-rich repeat (LRR) protein
MKNIVIVMLVVTVGVLGYFLLVRENPNNDASNDTAQSEQQTQDANSANGETIDLSNQGLEKIPTDILDDSSVVVLDVSGNNLTGSLPAEIRKLTNLETLDASDNDMTGIPAEIGQLSKLRIISYANNNISGLPLEIGNLKNLETLDLRGNPNVSTNDIGLIQPKIPNAKILTD